MKRSKLTDSQIMDARKRAEAGLAVPDACRELGISSALAGCTTTITSAEHGLGRLHPETAAGHGRMTLLLNPTKNGGITVLPIRVLPSLLKLPVWVNTEPSDPTVVDPMRV